jgi:hypothetical protein
MAQSQPVLASLTVASNALETVREHKGLPEDLRPIVEIALRRLDDARIALLPSS